MPNRVCSIAVAVASLFCCWPPAPAAAQSIPKGSVLPDTTVVKRELASLRTGGEFRLAQGDAEFAGNGPLVTITVAVRISADGRSILADLKGTAQETGGTTRAVLALDGAVLHTVEPGSHILSIDTARSATLSYTDTDHTVDFVCERAGEALLDGSILTMRNRVGTVCASGLVHSAAIIGDTNGADVNTGARDTRTTRTSAEIVFAPMTVTVRATKQPLASSLQPIALGVPFASNQAESFGDNGCGASAGWRVLASYGVKTDYPSFLKRMRSRPHVSNLFGIGVPPGLLADALNELSPGFAVRRLSPVTDSQSLASNLAARQTVKTKLIQFLRAGRPMIALLAWGDQGAYRGSPVESVRRYDGLWFPDLDEVNPRRMHYVAIRGYDPLTDTFQVVDNGMGSNWRADVLLDMMAFDRGPDLDIVFGLAAPDVQPMTVIVKP
jgi:hypothetical protein